MESLSAYARQFLGQMEKPDVDHIDGLSPAISIDQKEQPQPAFNGRHRHRDLRLHAAALRAHWSSPLPAMWPADRRAVGAADGAATARVAERHPADDPGAGHPRPQGEHQGILDEIRRQGFVRVRVDGNVLDIDEAAGLDLAKYRKHSIEVVVDRLVIRHDEGVTPEDHPDRVRIIESLETALKIANGIAEAQIVDGEAIVFSEKFSCPVHGVVGLTEIEPRNFSFNSPHGACPVCTGLGTTREFDQT